MNHKRRNIKGKQRNHRPRQYQTLKKDNGFKLAHKKMKNRNKSNFGLVLISLWEITKSC